MQCCPPSVSVVLAPNTVPGSVAPRLHHVRSSGLTRGGPDHGWGGSGDHLHGHPAPPLRFIAYSLHGRSASSPVIASRRSARLDAAHPEGSPALPIPERAELRAAARNLEPGTPSIPPSASSCSFSALESVPLGHLAKVASDSAIIFRGEVGPPLAQIAAIRAREVLDGKLAEARAALLVPPAASTSGGSSSPPRPQPTAPPPSVAVPEIRGRTRSRTAALRALSASCVLGSSSPPMAP